MNPYEDAHRRHMANKLSDSKQRQAEAWAEYSAYQDWHLRTYGVPAAIPAPKPPSKASLWVILGVIGVPAGLIMVGLLALIVK